MGKMGRGARIAKNGLTRTPREEDGRISIHLALPQQIRRDMEVQERFSKTKQNKYRSVTLRVEN